MDTTGNWYKVKYLWVDGDESSKAIMTVAMFRLFSDAQNYSKMLIKTFSWADRLLVYIETNEKSVYVYDYKDGVLTEKSL